MIAFAGTLVYKHTREAVMTVSLPDIPMEWLVISGAPWLFAAAVVGVGGVLWVSIFRGVISQKDLTIETLRAHIELSESLVSNARLKLAAEQVESRNLTADGKAMSFADLANATIDGGTY